ncbi:thiamine diphosphokinase [Enterococcus saccharolyticus]|uniref:Thiamine diphosphokinase n=1 Tax=Candidatus Enterococcus willemsii TaxID=1857215 RepID=A0ABQ6YVM5_9ENTE|nr:MULTISPECIES: thiamine diphosphokinase [Enterococcus]KAF1301201.1 thiamine pyrophosphokinase [Enterococcus sp. CU12B]MCD5003639.1 thiamine diphosphokinase [Enterococcus saccharolyticus]
MEILIVAGAPVETWPVFTPTYDYYIGIDRGGLFLQQQGLPLDIAVGDFDSLNEKERNLVFQTAKEVHQSPSEKDDTDTQLGLLIALQRFPEAKITLIGATGGRIDHFLANLWLVLEPRFQPFSQQIFLKDMQNTIQFLLPGEHTIWQEPDMKYLAYCCLTPVSALTLTESKYVLHEVDVMQPTSYASNEFLTNQAKISFKKGLIAVIQSKDK